MAAFVIRLKNVISMLSINELDEFLQVGKDSEGMNDRLEIIILHDNYYYY